MAFAYYVYALSNNGTGNLIAGSGTIAGQLVSVIETGAAGGGGTPDGHLTDAGGVGGGGGNANEQFSVAGGPAPGTYIFHGGYTNGDFQAFINGVEYFFSSQPVLTGGLRVINSNTYNPDGNGPYVWSNGNDTDITLTCFLAGTMIGTPGGATAIDKLAIGDLVLTADGSAKPVKFIGRQTVSMLFGDKAKSQPILIKAGALAQNVPARDLYTSPGHAMLIDGVLVIAGALVNGTSVVRWDDVPASFIYYHIELEGHDVVFAEGAATETYCDNVPRDMFDNADEFKALYPNAEPIAQLGLPTVKSARQLPPATRRRLDARAAAIGVVVGSSKAA
jgi:Hint domain